MDLRSIQNLTRAWQHRGQVGDIPAALLYGNQNAAIENTSYTNQSVVVDNVAPIADILNAALGAGLIKIPMGADLTNIAKVISGWYPYLNTPPNNYNWPANPGDFVSLITDLIAKGNTPQMPQLQALVNAAVGYYNAIGAIPYMPWDKLPWEWLIKDGGATKIVDAFKNNPAALQDAVRIMTEITLIPAGNGGTPTYSISGGPLHSIAPGKYAPPAFATIDWNAEPYKTLMQWFSQAGTAISKSADYWPLLFWMVSNPTAMAHVSYLSAMSQDIACYTDPSYGDGAQHFKEEIVKDSYTTPAWCTKSPGPGPGPNSCAATGQSCSDIEKCCEGSECKDGKCAEKSGNTIWWVIGGLGLVAGLTAVGFVMSGSKGARANPTDLDRAIARYRRPKLPEPKYDYFAMHAWDGYDETEGHIEQGMTPYGSTSHSEGYAHRTQEWAEGAAFAFMDRNEPLNGKAYARVVHKKDFSPDRVTAEWVAKHGPDGWVWERKWA